MSASQSPSADRDAMGRRSMVREQLEARGIRDRAVLQAMATVPREAFVPASLRHHAFEDRALAIGKGQTISQPYMVARMTVLLDLTHRGRTRRDTPPHVLDVGTGSGYQAAVLAQMGVRVDSIERDHDLAQSARARLHRLGYEVTVHVGDGSQGLPRSAPYAAIIVAAGAPAVPPALVGQLASDGRLVLPVGSQAAQRLTVVQRHGPGTVTSVADACVFVPLVGKDGHPS